MKSKILRIIDANYNRAKEGIRVSEDVARFILGSRRLTAEFRRARHELTRILLALPVSYREIVSQRDAREDVGRSHMTLDKRKIKVEDIFSSNIQRAEEAVRVLEEWSKIISIPSARRFQKLRFRLYELEKETFKKF